MLCNIHKYNNITQLSYNIISIQYNNNYNYHNYNHNKTINGKYYNLLLQEILISNEFSSPT